MSDDTWTPDDLPPPLDEEEEVGPGAITSTRDEWGWGAADEAATRLARRPDVFLTERAAGIVLVEDRAGYSTTIGAMDVNLMHDLFCRLRTKFIERVGKKSYAVPAPLSLRQTILTRRPVEAGWRPLAGLSPGPYVLASGEAVLDPGYNADTRLWLPGHAAINLRGVKGARVLQHGFTQELAARGCAYLLSELAQFCWADPVLDPPVWLAYLLTLLTRPSYPTCPLFLFTATKPRSGKDLLFYLAEMIVLGRQARHVPADKAPEEVEKIINTLLRGGVTPIILGDAEQLGGGTVFQLITEPDAVTVRLLGENTEIPVPPCLILGATGNQPRFQKGDLFGRMLNLHLDSDSPTPETRHFKKDQDQLIEWFRAERPRLLATAINLVRGFLHAQKAAPETIVRGVPCNTFPGWARMVRDALLWAGQADVVLTQERARKAIQVPGADAVKTLLQAMFDLWGLGCYRTSGELVKYATLPDPQPAVLGIDPIRASRLSPALIRESHEQLVAALDLIMPRKVTAAALTDALVKAIGSQELIENGKPTTFRFVGGSHNHMRTWALQSASYRG